MDESSPARVEDFVKNTPKGLLILRADRTKPDELQRYLIPATALGSYEISDPDVMGQAEKCLVCGGSGQCPACEGTGLNRFALPCLWCTPGILSCAKAGGVCSLCRGTGLPSGEPPSGHILPNTVNPHLA